jgi:hypothetical protein
MLDEKKVISLSQPTHDLTYLTFSKSNIRTFSTSGNQEG